MNYKFSIKVAALLATFTGTSIGPTSMVPSDWLASANAQQTAVTSSQVHSPTRSNMLAPLVPPVVKPGGSMPWKVNASEYRSAVKSGNQHRPALIKEGPADVRKNTVSVPNGNAAPPTVRQTVGTTADAATSSVQPAAASMAAPATGQIPSGFSAAGVPLYASSAATAQPYFAAAQPIAAPQAPRVATAPQGSGSRNAIGSGIAPGPAFPAPPVISPNSQQILAPSSTYDSGIAPNSVLTQGTVISEGPIFSEAPIASDPGLVAAPVASASTCNTCDTGAAAGIGGAAGCESCGGCNCGPNGCFDASEIASRAGLYGSVGEARYYGHLEAMIIDRQDGEVVFTPTLQLGGFDADAGYRVTLGERFDAINGREFSYWGTGQISSDQTLTGDIFPLNQVFQTTAATRTAITPFGFFTEGDAGTPSTLIRPTEQSHRAETYFHTFEVNRVRWAWDVFKSFAGIRYIYANDRYELDSTAVAPVNDSLSVITRGTYTNLAQNHLIGPHIGGEWFYDVGYRLSASVNLKGGVYANLNEVDTRLFRDGDAFVDTEAENTTLASSIEFGIHAHYQISPRGRFRAGFNILHLEDVATVTQNFPGATTDIDGTAVRTIGRATGTGANDNDDMTFTGFSFGLEFFR
jgi:hypothetical protein